MHVLTGSRMGGTISTQIACHYVVPAPDRVANAALDFELASFQSEVPNISQAELDAIKAGQLVERVIVIKHHHSQANAEILALARSQYAATASAALNDYRARYWQYLEAISGE